MSRPARTAPTPTVRACRTGTTAAEELLGGRKANPPQPMLAPHELHTLNPSPPTPETTWPPRIHMMNFRGARSCVDFHDPEKTIDPIPTSNIHHARRIRRTLGAGGLRFRIMQHRRVRTVALLRVRGNVGDLVRVARHVHARMFPPTETRRQKLVERYVDCLVNPPQRFFPPSTKHDLPQRDENPCWGRSLFDGIFPPTQTSTPTTPIAHQKRLPDDPAHKKCLPQRSPPAQRQ